jgi:hypothetical protein
MLFFRVSILADSSRKGGKTQEYSVSQNWWRKTQKWTLQPLNPSSRWMLRGIMVMWHRSRLEGVRMGVLGGSRRPLWHLVVHRLLRWIHRARRRLRIRNEWLRRWLGVGIVHWLRSHVLDSRGSLRLVVDRRLPWRSWLIARMGSRGRRKVLRLKSGWRRHQSVGIWCLRHHWRWLRVPLCKGKPSTQGRRDLGTRSRLVLNCRGSNRWRHLQLRI